MITIEECRVPMRDAVGLRTVVYRTPDGPPAPVLLTRTPYDITALMDGPAPQEYAAAGYCVVLQDCRGTAGSDGEWDPLSCEIDDGADTVAWVRDRDWCDGRVGMFGASYGSSAQWLALAGGARLEAFAPMSSTADFFQARFADGGPLRLSFNVLWAAQVTAQGMRRSGRREPALDALVPYMDFAEVTREGRWAEAQEQVAATAAPLIAHRPLTDLTAFRETAPWFYDWMFDEDPARPLWKRVSPVSYHDTVDCPGLHVAGWFDGNVEGTIANYRALAGRAGAAPQRLVIGPWRHWMPGETRIGEVDYGPGAARSVVGMHLDWFGEHLAGRSAPPAAPVEVFVMGADVWRTEPCWPPPGTRQVTYHLASDGSANTLDGDGRLAPEPGRADGEDRFAYDPADPVPSLGGRLFVLGERAGSFDQREIERRRDVLVYTSPPLGQDTEVVGLVTARIWLATSAPDTDVTVKLVDVRPDGAAMNVLDGVARARAVHPVPLSPGVPYDFPVRLGHTAQVFAAGHRIRVEVSSSNAPQFEPNPNTGRRTGTFGDGELVVARQRVLHGARRPSGITLPVRTSAS